jgi:hypothetical protein
MDLHGDYKWLPFACNGVILLCWQKTGTHRRQRKVNVTTTNGFQRRNDSSYERNASDVDTHSIKRKFVSVALILSMISFSEITIFHHSYSFATTCVNLSRYSLPVFCNRAQFLHQIHDTILFHRNARHRARKLISKLQSTSRTCQSEWLYNVWARQSCICMQHAALKLGNYHEVTKVTGYRQFLQFCSPWKWIKHLLFTYPLYSPPSPPPSPTISILLFVVWHDKCCTF